MRLGYIILFLVLSLVVVLGALLMVDLVEGLEAFTRGLLTIGAIGAILFTVALCIHLSI